MKWLESTLETFLDEKIHPWVCVVLKARVHIFSIVPSPHPPPPSSFLPLWSFLKMICNCFIPVLCGHWSDHVLGWWRHRDDPNVLFLKYKDLIRLDYVLLCFIKFHFHIFSFNNPITVG